MTEAALVFYTHPFSRGRIVRWMLEEVARPYETVLVDYGRPMRSEAYLALNPMGKVPTLVHGDAVVTECAAICAYLAAAFPEAGLGPERHERAAYYRWLFFGAGPLEALFGALSLGTLPADPRQEGMVGYGSVDRVVATLEHALTDKPYITGERFTAADVYLGSQIGWGMRFNGMPERAALSAYVERVTARPAHRRVTEIDGEIPDDLPT